MNRNILALMTLLATSSLCAAEPVTPEQITLESFLNDHSITQDDLQGICHLFEAEKDSAWYAETLKDAQYHMSQYGTSFMQAFDASMHGCLIVIGFSTSITLGYHLWRLSERGISKISSLIPN
jgi:hypothetical protein